MDAKCINPILNVSDISASFAWFEKWGSKKLWDWRTPPTLGAVGSGECEIFVCQGCQGGRGKGVNTSTFGPNGDERWHADLLQGLGNRATALFPSRLAALC